MSRMLFVNLPVEDLETSKAFFDRLGFTFNAQFTNESCACMEISEQAYAMLLTRERFADFITGDIADAKRSTECLLCLSCTSREEVDRLVATALEHGGARWKEPMDHGFMYGGSFQDPDGHVWEVMWMDAKVASGEQTPEAYAAQA